VIILSASLLVFFVGEFLSGFALVVKTEANTDYLTSSVDMIAKKEITTTEIPEIRKRVESSDYFIQEGDSLYSIGSKFKVSIDALKYVNNLTDSSVLRVGQKIVIPPVSGLVHTVKSGETLTTIAAKYQVASQAIADFNYLLDTKLAVGTELVIPGATVPEPIAPPVYAAPNLAVSGSYGAQATASKGFCVWPTTVRIVTQNFTWYHNGLDIATPWSGGMPPIFSCTGGTVIRAGWDPWGLGLHVRIDHGNGYTSIYGHMSRLDVRYGQKVGRGQQLGLMGSTGNSSGPHVHFMVEFNGRPQNPFNFTN
jgi:murein DD-endopeptidase MepM/ murein hydrolase activator NlpD